MRIEGIDITSPVRPVRGQGVGQHLGPATQRRQDQAAEVPSRQPVDDAPLETYSLRDTHRSAVRGDDGPAEFTPPDQAVRMFSKLSGLWDTFREMGVFPPPKSYNGFKVVTPTEVMIPDVSSPEGQERGKLSAAEEASIAMVEHMLRRFVIESKASEESTGPAEMAGDESADVRLQAMMPDGRDAQLQAHAELTPEARMEGGRFRPSAGEAMDSFFAETGSLPEQTLRLEIDVAGAEETSRDSDGEPVGRALSVWGRDEQGQKRLLAWGREGQGAIYVGHEEVAESKAMSPPARGSVSRTGARGGLSPYEQAALGQLGNLDLAV